MCRKILVRILKCSGAAIRLRSNQRIAHSPVACLDERYFLAGFFMNRVPDMSFEDHTAPREKETARLAVGVVRNFEGILDWILEKKCWSMVPKEVYHSFEETFYEFMLCYDTCTHVEKKRMLGRRLCCLEGLYKTRVLCPDGSPPYEVISNRINSLRRSLLVNITSAKELKGFENKLFRYVKYMPEVCE